jgi:hypothetical protein
VSFAERTATYTYLPEARPVIDALRRLGQRVEAACLDTFRPELPHQMALATACPDAPTLAALQAALDEAFKDNRPTHDLVRWALVRRHETGYVVAFPSIIAVPIRVIG